MYLTFPRANLVKSKVKHVTGISAVRDEIDPSSCLFILDSWNSPDRISHDIGVLRLVLASVIREWVATK